MEKQESQNLFSCFFDII